MGTYLRIARVPRMTPLLSANLLARLPIGINGLAVVLFLRAQTGSFAIAGAAAGALALGSAAGAPVGARVIDRFGPRVLLVLAAAHAAGLGGLLALGLWWPEPAALVVAALLAGAAQPRVSSVLRVLYPRLLGGDPALVQGAYALDSVLTETIFVAGPLIVGALVVVVDPGAALVVSGAAVIAGTVAFVAALPDAEEAEVDPAVGRDPLGALRAPGIRTLVLTMVPVGFALGTLEIALPAFADAEGRPELAGLFLAIWSVGSAAGGLLYGARPRRASLTQVHLRVAVLVPLGLLPVALAGSPLAMALLVVPAGVFIAPLIATRNELAGTVAPAGAETEAYTWPITALVAGVALGAAAAGTIVDVSGWRAAVLAGTASAAIGAAIALARRGTLRGAAAVPGTS